MTIGTMGTRLNGYMHDFDIKTERCIYCGVDRCDSTANCVADGKVRWREVLHLSPAPTWTRTMIPSNAELRRR